MTPSIIITCNQNGWERHRGPVLSQPSASGVTALSIFHRERFGAIFARTVVPVMRTVRALNSTVGFTQAWGISHNPDPKSVRVLSQSAALKPLCRSAIAALSSQGGVTAGGLSHAPTARRRLFLQFLGAVFRPLRSLSFPLRVQPSEQPRRGFTDSLRSFACVSLHAQQQSMEFDAWRTEKLSLRNHNQGMSV